MNKRDFLKSMSATLLGGTAIATFAASESEMQADRQFIWLDERFDMPLDIYEALVAKYKQIGLKYLGEWYGNDTFLQELRYADYRAFNEQITRIAWPDTPRPEFKL